MLYAKYVPFADKTIDYGNISVTIMDRNLGATSTTAGGFRYQWGNNNGFTNKTNETPYRYIQT